MRGLLIGMGLFASLAMVANAEEITYTTHIKRIIDAQCVFCHGKNAPEHGDFKKDKEGFTKRGLGPKMDSYATSQAMQAGRTAARSCAVWMMEKTRKTASPATCTSIWA